MSEAEIGNSRGWERVRSQRWSREADWVWAQYWNGETRRECGWYTLHRTSFVLSGSLTRAIFSQIRVTVSPAAAIAVNSPRHTLPPFHTLPIPIVRLSSLAEQQPVILSYEIQAYSSSYT